MSKYKILFKDPANPALTPRRITREANNTLEAESFVPMGCELVSVFHADREQSTCVDGACTRPIVEEVEIISTEEE